MQSWWIPYFTHSHMDCLTLDSLHWWLKLRMKRGTSFQVYLLFKQQIKKSELDQRMASCSCSLCWAHVVSVYNSISRGWGQNTFIANTTLFIFKHETTRIKNKTLYKHTNDRYIYIYIDFAIIFFYHLYKVLRSLGY